jgi:hypothetical protein
MMFYIIVILAGIFAMPAKADETLKWRIVQHSTSNQTQQVDEGHFLGLFRSPGIAFFPDGSTGTSLVIGTPDFVSGVGGTTNGYYNVKFADGSELWLKYTGTFELGAKEKLRGTATVISGKGRYADAKGGGTWEGEGTSGADPIQYIDNVINIKN